MGLDLSKAADRKPLLGRGRIPEEVKRRLQGGETEPEDEKVARLHARTRRLKRQGYSLDDYLSSRLNEVGGKWEKPETWSPKSPVQRRAWEQYNKRLDEERRVSPLAVHLTSLVRQEFAKSHSRMVSDNVHVFRDTERKVVVITCGLQKYTLADETLQSLDTQDIQPVAAMIARELGSRL